MTRFDEYVEMPRALDNAVYELLKPLCGQLTIACMDAAWEAVVGVLAKHVEGEAVTATREAVRDAQ